MLLWFFTILDFLCALIIIGSTILPQKIIFYGAVYLILKGGFFAYTGDIISWLDLIVGIYMVFLIFSVGSLWITLLAFFYLLQKVVMSAI